jgi:hypothetical protein
MKRKTKPLAERSADYANKLRGQTANEICVAIFAYEAGFKANRRIEARLRKLLRECVPAVDIAIDSVIPSGRAHWQKLAKRLEDLKLGAVDD